MPNLFDSLLERMEGRKYQTYFAAFCPFEEHKSPALLVYEDGYVCLSCRKTGSLEYLNNKIGSHYTAPIRIDTESKVLPRWRRWEEKYGDLKGIAWAAHKQVNKTYLKRRKIYEYAEEGWLGTLDNWLTFPVFDRDRTCIDIVVRSLSVQSDVRYVVRPSEHGGSRPLYCPSWERIEQSEVVYVVYGIVDAISMYLAGLPAVTGTTGKSLSAEQLIPLHKRFVIVPDDGEEREAHRLANKLGWRAHVKELKYVDGCKDPDDIRKHFGNEYLLQAIGA